MYKRFSGKVLKDDKILEIFCYFMMFETSSDLEIIVKVSSGLTSQPIRAVQWRTMTSKHLDLLEGCPSAHCFDVVEIQVSKLRENNFQHQSTSYIMMIVYLIEDNFRSPSTHVLDKISMSTVALFVSAYQELHTTLKSSVIL